ncbi:hypothetical protein ACJA27_02095 [Mycoplasmopsis lipophila]|uniref:hypothetical protein n=1 Tax=Mycoplasmopsis lipophila TaxID=2117 RepID=UPI003873C3F7
MQKYNNDEILVNKKEFNKKIGEFQNPKFTIRYIKDLGIIKCEITCDLNDLKVPKPPKETDMNNLGNLTIEQLTSIIKTVVVKNTLSKEDVIQIVDEKLKPIQEQMVTKQDVIEIVDQKLKPIQDDIKEMKEDIKMLKSFHTKDIENYYKNK